MSIYMQPDRIVDPRMYEDYGLDFDAIEMKHLVPYIKQLAKGEQVDLHTLEWWQVSYIARYFMDRKHVKDTWRCLPFQEDLKYVNGETQTWGHVIIPPDYTLPSPQAVAREQKRMIAEKKDKARQNWITGIIFVLKYIHMLFFG